MDTQPLFLDTNLKFEGQVKIAGTLAKLNDNSDYWTQEISQEAYKRLPFLSNYEVNIVLDRVDDVRGYAFGSVEVRPRSDLSQSERESRPILVANIPIIIKENMLYPFDVFVVEGRYRYLTEERLNEALFRPDTFDAVRQRPVEYSLSHELIPPALSATGGFGIGGLKTASIPLLPLLDGRVLEDHKGRLHEALQDPSVKVAFANSTEGVKAALLSASKLEPSDPTKTAEAVWDRIRPNVVQISKLASGQYRVRYTNTSAYSPREEIVSEKTAQALAGPAAETLSEEESVTASPEMPASESSPIEGLGMADSFGLWTVKDASGRDLVGWVFPEIMTCDGQPTGLKLFTNGSVYAIQDEIAGRPGGDSMELPNAEPSGRGCFYSKIGGQPIVHNPITIINTAVGPDGLKKYIGEKDTGEPVIISKAEGVQMAAKVADGEYIIPATYGWMPLTEEVELIRDPSLMSKVAQRSWERIVEIVGDADVFSFRGGPLAKVAESNSKFLNRKDAEFLGAALGMSNSLVKSALDKAARGDLVAINNCRTLGNAQEKMAQARDQVRRELAILEHPIRNYFLLKEASVLSDAMTADKILGLGFLNAENVATFIDLLPGLDEASENIAELLIASRLGLQDVPEAALERMLFAIEDVIRGLKILQQKEQASATGM